GEVVVDEAVGHPGLVGDVRDPAGVKALPGKDAHRGVEDQPALVRGRLGGRIGAHAYTPVRRWVSAGSRRGMSWRAEKSSSATIAASLSGAVASTSPQGSTISERPPERWPGGWGPIWLGAITKHWFSIARARTRTSQW